MDDRLWLVLLNSAAGFGAFAVWGWLAYVRSTERQWALMATDIVVAVGSLTAGLTFALIAARHEFARTMAEIMLGVLPIVLTVPAVLGLRLWERAQRFRSEVEGDDNGEPRGS